MAYLGNRPATGENNAFRILDDISSHVVSFDGSSASVVSLANDTITITDDKHRYVTGQRITYGKGGGTVITGLTDATAYYVIRDSATTIQLATTASNASNGVAINLTGLGAGTAHTITLAFDGINTKFKATYENGTQDPLITRAAQLVLSLNGVIQQPVDSTTPSTGFGIDHTGTIIFSTAPASTDNFWGHVLASNTVTFDISDNTIDSFTGTGSAVNFTLSKIPPDNRNILVTLDGVVQYPSDNSTTRAYTLSENELQFVSAPGLGVDIQVRHIGFAGASSGGGGGGVTGFYGRTGNVVLKSTDNPTIGNLTAVDGTFSGNVAIAKTLTYMDVTNIDAVGIVTFQDDVQYNGSGVGISSAFWDKSANEFKFKDGVKLSFGDSQDLSIYHDGSDSRITNGGGLTYILGDVIRFRNHGDSGTVLNAALSGVDLYASTSIKLSTTGYGATVFGTIETQKLNVTGISTFGGASTFNSTTTHNEDVTFTGANFNALWDKSKNALILNDNTQLNFGTDEDGDIYHDDSQMIVNNAKGALKLRSNTIHIAGTGNEKHIVSTTGVGVTVYYNDSARLTTTSDGVTVTPNLTANSVLSSYGGIQTKLGFISGGAEGFVGTISDHSLFIKTNDTNRIKIANNSPATAIGTNAGFNGMLTVRGDISGQLLHLKATEDTSRLMVSGTDTNGCEVNLYDGAGGQKGILGVSTGEFFIKAPNNGAPMGFYTHNGSSIGLRLKINSAGDILLGTDQATIGCNTADGSDNRNFSLCGGSDASQSRGAVVTIYGNEANNGSSQYGTLSLKSGNTTSGFIDFWTQGAKKAEITKDGVFRIQSTYDGSASTSNAWPALNITNLQGTYTANNILGGVTFGKAAGHVNGIRAGMLAIYQGNGSNSGNVGVNLSFRTSANGGGDSTEKLFITDTGVLCTGNYRGLLDQTMGSIQINGDGSGGRLGFRGTTTSPYGGLGEIHGYWGTNKVASILFHAGTRTGNGQLDDGEIRMYTRPVGAGGQERLRITSDGQLIYKTNKNSGYIAEFHQLHADNPGTIQINSPTDNNLRPAAVHLAQAGTVKWVVGQVYNSTSDRAFHICSGTGQANSKLVVTTAGFVGINTTNPQRYLHIVGNDGATGASLGNSDSTLVLDNKGGNGAMIEFLGDNTGAGHLMFTDTDGSNRGRFSYSHNTDSMRFDVKGQEALTLYTKTVGSTTSAVLGINDNSPATDALGLVVRNKGSQESALPVVLIQRDNNAGGGSGADEIALKINMPYTYNNAGGCYGIKSYVVHNLNGLHYGGYFEARGSQYDAGGSGAGCYATIHKTDTNGPGYVPAFYAYARSTYNATSTGYAVGMRIKLNAYEPNRGILIHHELTNSNWTRMIAFHKGSGANGTEVGSIKSSNNATQYNTSSDYRLKENVVDLTGAIARLKQLKPKRFNFKNDTSKTVDGFIAHEVEPVVPQAVSGEKDAVKIETIADPETGLTIMNEDGTPKTETKIDPQEVDYSKLSTLTIAALQEALAKIETLEAKVAALEGS